MKIPIMKPMLGTFEEVAPYLKRIDQTKIYSNRGPLVCELEEAYSEYLSTNRNLVVALANATLAIQGLVEISKNNNWIVPDYTFSATGLAVLKANRNLLICDVNLHDWKIDLDLINGEHKSYGIIPVMPFGATVDFNPYMNFEDVIIDAAASLGAFPPNFRKMKKGWAVVYSLHATKVLGAGEGAIVVCGSDSQAEQLRAWSNFGFSSNRISEIQGTNAKMSEVNAAYGLHSINNVERERCDWYESQSNVTSQTKDYEWATSVNSTQLFQPYWIAKFSSTLEKTKVVNALEESGIQSRSWWVKPLSAQKPFSECVVLGSKGVSEKLSGEHLGLPMFRGLSLHQVVEVSDKINVVAESNKK